MSHRRTESDVLIVSAHSHHSYITSPSWIVPTIRTRPSTPSLRFATKYTSGNVVWRLTCYVTYDIVRPPQNVMRRECPSCVETITTSLPMHLRPKEHLRVSHSCLLGPNTLLAHPESRMAPQPPLRCPTGRVPIYILVFFRYG